MAGITAAQVKELRERTGAGMMDCKKALGETAGDMGDAADWLRKKGLAAAAKKAGRVAAEGLIGVAVRDGTGAVVEVNAETDFVARNETFQAFVSQVAEIALDTGGDLDRIQAADCPGTGRTVAEELTHLIATVGENMSLRRATLVDAGDGVIASYIHNLVAPGQGRIGVLVGVAGGEDREAMAAFGRQVAMHVAATAPQAVTVGDLDPAVVERERRFLTDQAATSGKPPDIVERMVEGRLRKFYEEIVLTEQTWVIDGETRVGDVVAALAGETGGAPAVTGFVRFALGEGIEKGETDFAAEVAGLVDG